jgi:hypothetical protein
MPVPHPTHAAVKAALVEWISNGAFSAAPKRPLHRRRKRSGRGLRNSSVSKHACRWPTAQPTPCAVMTSPRIEYPGYPCDCGVCSAA